MRYERGQTLIEVLIGLATAVVVIAAITTATISSLNNATFSKNQNLATQYAQQGMEILRNMRDSDYGSFSALSGTYCLAKTCSALAANNANCWTPTSGNTCNQNVDIFVRQIDVQQNSLSCDGTSTKVVSTVSWFDAKCTSGNNTFCHQVSLTSCLSNAQVVPVP